MTPPDPDTEHQLAQAFQRLGLSHERFKRNSHSLRLKRDRVFLELNEAGHSISAIARVMDLDHHDARRAIQRAREARRAMTAQK